MFFWSNHCEFWSYISEELLSVLRGGKILQILIAGLNLVLGRRKLESLETKKNELKCSFNF